MYSHKVGRRVAHHPSKRESCSQNEVLSLSAVRGDFFQAMDVPVLVMCSCGRRATSLASQILDESARKIHTNFAEYSAEADGNCVCGGVIAVQCGDAAMEKAASCLSVQQLEINSATQFLTKIQDVFTPVCNEGGLRFCTHGKIMILMTR